MGLCVSGLSWYLGTCSHVRGLDRRHHGLGRWTFPVGSTCLPGDGCSWKMEGVGQAFLNSLRRKLTFFLLPRLRAVAWLPSASGRVIWRALTCDHPLVRIKK